MLKTTNLDLKSLVHQKRDEIISISAKHGAYNILEQLSPWFPSGLKQELETLLNTKVGIITTNSLKDNNQEIFLQQGIPL
jgi:hypothetical protein